MSRRVPRHVLVAGIALFGLLLILPNVPGFGVARSGFAPTPTSGLAYGPRTLGPTSPAAPSRIAAPSAPGVHAALLRPTGASPDAINPCSPTTNWVSGSTKFFNDVSVCDSLPGGKAGSLALPLVPRNGVIPEYANGFYVNVTTNVPILGAELCLWATTWPAPGVGAQPIPGYTDAGWDSSDCQTMIIGGHPNQPDLKANTAYFFVDCYKYFWPGTNLSWMINVTSSFGVVSSYKQIYENESYSDGYTTYPTWTASVQGPFASSNFSNDVRLVTVPSTLSSPAYSPNPTQSVQMQLNSYNLSGGAPSPIPAAVMLYRVQLPASAGGTNLSYSSNFGPANSTVMTLDTPIPPQVPGAVVWFNVSLWLFWDGQSHIDQVASRGYYHFHYTDNGRFPQPNEPLEKNALLASYPNVINQTAVTFLPTGTPVNLTIHEPRQNVTFSSAEVDFTVHDHGGSFLSTVPMHAASPNTSYVILPGLPPGASLSFRVIARDVNRTGDPSGEYTYTESGPSVPAPPSTTGFFYVEVYDVATNLLVGNVTFTVSNLSWSQTTHTTNFGFGALHSSSSGLPLYLADGSYTLVVHTSNATIQRQIVVQNTTPFSVIFYLSTSAVPVQSFSPPSALFAFAGVAGLLGAAVTFYPLSKWFRERRAKAEAEQRRVTL